MRSLFGACLFGLFFTGGSAATVACSPCKVGGQDPVRYTDGNTNASRTLYETMAADEEMLHFPQGRTYDLVHGLGYRPHDVNIFLSFRERLTATGDTEDKTEPNNVAQSAGNQAVIQVWNDEIIQVRNDTCAEFYMRAVVIGDPELAATQALGGAAGAPAD